MSRADQEVFKLELMVERDTSRIAVSKPRVTMASPGEGNPVGTFTLLLGAHLKFLYTITHSMRKKQDEMEGLDSSQTYNFTINETW